jgi:outer membrane protein TolC
MQQAIMTNPDILEARADYERQAGVLMSVRSALLPKAEAVGSANSRDRSLTDTSPSSASLPPSQQTSVAEKSYNLGIEFKQLAFDGFSAFNQFRQHRYLKQTSFWRLVSASYRVLADVQQAYDAILMNEGVVETNKETVASFEKLADISAKRQAVGDVTVLDGLRVQTELKRAKADLAAAYSMLVRSIENFRKLLQVPTSSDLPEEVFLEGPLEQKYFLMAREDALARADALQPEILSAREEMRAAKMKMYSSFGDYLPRVDTFARYNLQSSYYDFDHTLDGWVLGVQGRWNLFDSFGREGVVQADRAALKASRVRLGDRRYRIASQVRELYAQLDAMRQSIEFQHESIRLGERTVREGERLYAVGMSGVEEVIDAQLTLRRAQIDLLQRVFENNRYVYELEYAIGMQWVDPMVLTSKKD